MLIAVLLYLSILVLVGAYRSRQVKTGDDFLVAGRTLPARVLVFTLLATWVGSGSLFGGAGLGYRAGFPALWQSAGAWVGIALVYFIAPRVRRIAQYRPRGSEAVLIGTQAGSPLLQDCCDNSCTPKPTYFSVSRSLVPLFKASN